MKKAPSIKIETQSIMRGRVVLITIDNMGIYRGTKVSIERRFTDFLNQEETRLEAAKYIRRMRKLWNDGILLDIVHDGVCQ